MSGRPTRQHVRPAPPCLTTPNTHVPSPSLKKGATFQTPTTPPAERSEPKLPAVARLPRAQTCPQALEDLVANRERRMATYLSSFTGDLRQTASQSTRDQDAFGELPLPQGVIDTAVSEASSQIENMVLYAGARSPGRSHPRRHRHSPAQNAHASDSGLGSSLSDGNRADSHCAEVRASCKSPFPLPFNIGPTISSTHLLTHHSVTAINRPRTRSGRGTTSTASSARAPSAITRSHSALTPSTRTAPQHALTPDAIHLIQRRILTPILQRQFLKDFFPLLRDIPRRIKDKDILCVRDLEKTLLLLAPVSGPLPDYKDRKLTLWFSSVEKERAKSPHLYLNFCETSIHCIQATVGHLGDADQRRPADRPYTDAYFVDLVQQVRHYAGIMAASRNKEASGRNLNDNDYHPYDASLILRFHPLTDFRSERVVLHGGLSETGKPAELVRVRDGKRISISTGAEVEEIKTEGMKPPKRSSSHLKPEDDPIHRSMGSRRRRRVSDESPAPRVCRQCNKEFPRNCDLTKHEKTHTRPWKCSEPTCEFATRGWPTEKERDRHYSDRHMDGPKFFCENENCDYASKRESNCKQHMEKSHGWKYIRSKNNGKKGTAQARPTTKKAVRAGRKAAQSTPQTASIPTPESSNTPMSNSPYEAPYTGTGPYQGPSPVEYDDEFFQDPLADFPMPQTSYPGFSSPYNQTAAAYPSAADFPEQHFPHTSPMDEMLDFYSSQSDQTYMQFNAQMPTPMASAQQPVLSSFSYPSVSRPQNPNLSPTAHEDVMLYTPGHQGAEFDDPFTHPELGVIHSDFNLYSSGGESSAAPSVANANMFPSLESQTQSQQTGLEDFLGLGHNAH
ncbi:MAG: copper-binding transcription factor [Vezdaea aestivalis]|nr:MAG: copper-binding transcription factor [Vezdaea aestivalis]